MKKTVLSTLALSIVLGAGISTAQAETRIGVTIYKYDDNFMALMRKEIDKEASQFKDVKLLMNDSQNTQSIQNDQVDVLLSKGVKALAINLVDPSASKTIIDKAKGEDLPIVFFNKDPGEKAIASYDKAYYVGTDPKESGLIQGDLIAKQWKANPALDLNKDGKVQYALLKGEPGHPDAEARTKYVVEGLAAQGIQSEQIFMDAALWDAAQAKDKVDAWLSSGKAKDIEVIISNNDGMALGALEATKAHGRKLPIFGVDALPEALQLVKKGELAGTVLNDGAGQGKAVVQLAANLAEGKAAGEGTNWKIENRVVRIPYVGVDKDNLEKFLK
ncbi:galactose/glucose ABC transporter substrate-binding protein MglB [Actinobacillus pleuropneumoniae]|uniref:D-galactose/methyl-galactoside binding periplasmic protein MglB n=1 Tax=Actinobacillus pleuropneumoniae serovar 6 str. Femo TaxID=754256 RepID=A0A828PS24_ACTPL|nr:galactose/glucose ABC transporter substrate-binding protein MglB [Actinobacillus pleuropneumoniae]EFL80436.1 D-galactose-binding periplasmic protein precursor [Actinobacillus pleuropneumoniae serovar 6 str. Femo]EFM91477.1 D-galactose-binding periplasmic protein [Actinobacillus pleuropneumoniae serovar 6 str. Femo]UKH11896.1 galactose/glucose ABC transporter substrate-binding protein MglB [Actinobacillus pleuropneumoniae serovar 6 str. Femo]SUU66911.1 periplasmic sugar-binding protein [Actin